MTLVVVVAGGLGKTGQAVHSFNKSWRVAGQDFGGYRSSVAPAGA